MRNDDNKDDVIKHSKYENANLLFFKNMIYKTQINEQHKENDILF